MQASHINAQQGSLFLIFGTTVQNFKICETGIFAKDTPPKLIFFCYCIWFCDQKFEWRPRNEFFCDRFFNLRSQTKPMHPMQIPCLQMTHRRPGTTRNTSDVMRGINLIFAIISNFALYFLIVRLQLIFLQLILDCVGLTLYARPTQN